MPVDVADHLQHGWLEVQPEVRPGSEVRDPLDRVVKDEGKEASNSPAVRDQSGCRGALQQPEVNRPGFIGGSKRPEAVQLSKEPIDSLERMGG
jgi:hypothetical protein